MSNPKDEEAKFNDTLKRMLDKKPTPHKPAAEEGKKRQAEKPK